MGRVCELRDSLWNKRESKDEQTNRIVIVISISVSETPNSCHIPYEHIPDDRFPIVYEVNKNKNVSLIHR